MKIAILSYFYRIFLTNHKEIGLLFFLAYFIISYGCNTYEFFFLTIIPTSKGEAQNFLSRLFLTSFRLNTSVNYTPYVMALPPRVFNYAILPPQTNFRQLMQTGPVSSDSLPLMLAQRPWYADIQSFCNNVFSNVGNFFSSFNNNSGSGHKNPNPSQTNFFNQPNSSNNNVPVPVIEIIWNDPKIGEFYDVKGELRKCVFYRVLYDNNDSNLFLVSSFTHAQFFSSPTGEKKTVFFLQTASDLMGQPQAQGIGDFVLIKKSEVFPLHPNYVRNECNLDVVNKALAFLNQVAFSLNESLMNYPQISYLFFTENRVFTSYDDYENFLNNNN